MSRAKQTSKRRGRSRVVTALGVAGALSLAGGASASISPAGDIPTRNTAPVLLAEEEISDVSLATFYVFDKENAGAHRSGVQLAAKRVRTREAAEAAQPTQAAEAAPTPAAEAAPCTAAAVAARPAAAAAAEEDAEAAAVYGLDQSGSADLSKHRQHEFGWKASPDTPSPAFSPSSPGLLPGPGYIGSASKVASVI